VKIGIITARDAAYHPNRRLLEAGASLGVEVALLHPFHIWSGLALGKPLAAGITGLEGFDLLLPRVGATISDYSLTLLTQLEMMGLRLVNGSKAIAICRHKFITSLVLSAAGLPVLDTYMVNSLTGYADAVRRLGGTPVVVKLASSRQGSGVFLVEDNGPDPGLDPQLGDERLSRIMRQREGVLVQRYLPPAARRDVRVVLLGQDKAWAMEITPAPGEFRANVHLGGQGHAIPAQGEVLNLAQKARQAVGLDIAGVDLMQDAGGAWWLGEVNFTPGFKGLEQATGDDVANKILRFSLQTLPK
jgi:ribosomal protein S6--L-glutamate ligase